MSLLARAAMCLSLVGFSSGISFGAESASPKEAAPAVSAPASAGASPSTAEKGSAVVDSSSSPAGSGKKEPVIKGRIPSGWGSLELSGEQKAEVYKLQEKHRLAELDVAKELKAARDHVRELNKKLDDMKAASDAELQTVLTPSQKEMLLKKEKKVSPSGMPSAAAK